MNFDIDVDLIAIPVSAIIGSEGVTIEKLCADAGMSIELRKVASAGGEGATRTVLRVKGEEGEEAKAEAARELIEAWMEKYMKENLGGEEKAEETATSGDDGDDGDGDDVYSEGGEGDGAVTPFMHKSKYGLLLTCIALTHSVALSFHRCFVFGSVR